MALRGASGARYLRYVQCRGHGRWSFNIAVLHQRLPWKEEFMRGLDLAGFLLSIVTGAMQDLTSTAASGSKSDNWMWWLYSPSFF